MSQFRSNQLILALSVLTGVLAGCFGTSSGSGSDSSTSPSPAPIEHKLLYFTSTRTGPTYKACGYIDLQTDTVYELTQASLIHTFDVCSAYTYANGVVLFKGSGTGNEYQLFYHDIESNTVGAVAVNTGGSSDPYGFIVLNDKIYFNATTAAAGSELWVFDTVSKTASLVSDIRPGAASSNANSFATHQGKLYFSANNGTQGTEPYVYDPDTNTTSLLGDVYTGATGSSPSDFISLGSKVYFVATSSANGRELYSYDPAGPTLTRLTDINPGASNSISAYTVARDGNYLYFAGTDGSDGLEPYRYDTVGNSVSRLDDINPGAGNSTPSGFIAFSNKIYFYADDGVVGQELFVYDPAVPSVTLAHDFDGTAASSAGGTMGILGSSLIVVGETAAHGMEYYKVDSAGVVSRITDIYSNAGDSSGQNPKCHAFYNGIMYHHAYSALTDSAIYKTNPAALTTSIYQEFVDANLGEEPCALKLVEHTEN